MHSTSKDFWVTSPSSRRHNLPFDDRMVVCNLSGCRYKLVHDAVEKMGYVVTHDEEDKEYTLFWMDKSSLTERVGNLRNFQVINHFPFAHMLSKRTQFAKSYNKLRALHPSVFDFYPETHALPMNTVITDELGRRRRKKFDGEAFIVKSNKKNLFSRNVIVLDRSNLRDEIFSLSKCIFQKYIDNPLLMEGRKFDLRMFVLVTSLRPLTIFLLKEGIVRLAGEEYVPIVTDDGVLESEELHDYFGVFVHGHSPSVHISSPEKAYYTTTYPKFKPVYKLEDDGEESIKKKEEESEGEQEREEYSTERKRCFKFFRNWVEGEGKDYERIFDSIGEVIVKTILVGYPRILQAYKTATEGNKVGSSFTCFEIFGVDLMLDSDWKPWLLDIFHSPAYSCYCELEKKVKSRLLLETFKLLALDGSRTERTKEYYFKEREKKLQAELFHQEDGFKRIFPTNEFVLSNKEFLDGIGVEYDTIHSKRYMFIKDSVERIDDLFVMMEEDFKVEVGTYKKVVMMKNDTLKVKKWMLCL